MDGKQTIVPTWIGLLVILGVLLYILGAVVFGNTQWANLRRIERWIEAQQPEWEKLKAEHPGLEEVSISPFTQGNGMLLVQLRDLKLSSEDEAALYRYLLESEPPRPVKLSGGGNDAQTKIATIEYASVDDFVSMTVLEASNLHTKEFRRTLDGKVILFYSVQKYNPATGKTHWEESIYWTWEKDLPEQFISQMKIDY